MAMATIASNARSPVAFSTGCPSRDPSPSRRNATTVGVPRSRRGCAARRRRTAPTFRAVDVSKAARVQNPSVSPSRWNVSQYAVHHPQSGRWNNTRVRPCGPASRKVPARVKAIPARRCTAEEEDAMPGTGGNESALPCPVYHQGFIIPVVDFHDDISMRPPQRHSAPPFSHATCAAVG